MVKAACEMACVGFYLFLTACLTDLVLVSKPDVLQRSAVSKGKAGASQGIAGLLGKSN